MKWYYYLAMVVIFFSLTYINIVVVHENNEELAQLKKNSITEGTECVDGVLYATYSFKDLVVYEPQYISCSKEDVK